MKKLLILAYDFPPYVSVGGLRPYSWYRYLREFDVEPIVVTRQFENNYKDERDYIAPSKCKKIVVEQTEYGTILRSPYFPNMANKLYLRYGAGKYTLIRRLITAFFEISQYLWISGPKKQLYYTANEYLKNNEVDAIIATGDPFVLFFFAKGLSKKFRIPWLADYRDPWSQNKENQNNCLIKYFNERTEKRVMQSVKAVCTVSEFFKKTIEVLLPKVPFYILPNGYNPESIERIKDIPQNSECLRISFAGTIYQWHPWQSFLKIFIKWKKEHPLASAELCFYGTNINGTIQEYISAYYPEGLPFVSIYPKMPNEKLLNELAKSNVLLLFNDYSVMGTKICDYLGLRRKVLLCYESDKDALALKRTHYNVEELPGCSQRLQAEVMKETNGGIVVQNENHLLLALNDLWNEFEKSRTVRCDSVGVDNYSHRIQVGKLAQIVTDLK